MSKRAIPQSQSITPSIAAATIRKGELERVHRAGTATSRSSECDDFCRVQSSRNWYPDKDAGTVRSAARSALACPGNSLDASTQSSMEYHLAKDFAGVQVRFGYSDRLRLGQRDDSYERQAERIADGADQKSQVVTTPEYLGSLGNSRKHVDLSGVRIHTGPKANEAARAVNAQAFTVANKIVFGAGQYSPHTEQGRKILAHELSHVMQQSKPGSSQLGLVQRVGFFQSIARFFGGGTFSNEELIAYLESLRGGKIEDEIASDNKARAVAKRGLFKRYGWETRALLIQEMLSGFTGGDDREGILAILTSTKEESPDDLERIINKVGDDKLRKKFSGDDRDKLYVILGSVETHKAEPVETDWWVGYTVKGAEELRMRNFGLVVDELVAAPENSNPILVARAATNQNISGAPQKIAGGLDLPRGKGGVASIAFHVAPRADDGTVAENIGTGPKLTEVYPPVTLDRRRVTASIKIEYGRQKTGEVTSGTGSEVQQGEEQRKSVKDISGQATKAQEKKTTGKEVKVGGQISKSQEKQEAQEQSIEDISTFKGTTTLSGKITPEISAALKGKIDAGAQIDGKLLGLLLRGVTGPAGSALGKLLGSLLPSTTFSVGAAAEAAYKLTVELKGEVALEWSKTHKDLFKKGTIESQKQEAKLEIEKRQSQGSESMSEDVVSKTKEVETGQKKTLIQTKKVSEAKTAFISAPIIDKAGTGVKFEVT